MHSSVLDDKEERPAVGRATREVETPQSTTYLSTQYSYRTLSMACIDSSTLISLAKIDELQILKTLKTTIKTVNEVREETVIQGIQHGHYDATKIKKAFDDGTITVQKPDTHDTHDGISDTDSKVLNVALAEDYLFTDDVKLRRKAQSENIKVRSTPDILLQLVRTNRLEQATYKELLTSLETSKRITTRVRERYAEVIDHDRNGTNQRDPE